MTQWSLVIGFHQDTKKMRAAHRFGVLWTHVKLWDDLSGNCVVSLCHLQ